MYTFAHTLYTDCCCLHCRSRPKPWPPVAHIQNKAHNVTTWKSGCSLSCLQKITTAKWMPMPANWQNLETLKLPKGAGFHSYSCIPSDISLKRCIRRWLDNLPAWVRPRYHSTLCARFAIGMTMCRNKMAKSVAVVSRQSKLTREVSDFQDTVSK